MGKKKIGEQTASEALAEANKVADAVSAAASKSVSKKKTRGRVYVKSSYNNTVVTVTDEKGNVMFWSTAGALGFNGPKKATPFAASKVVAALYEKMKKAGMTEVDVTVSGIGGGRDSAIRSLANHGINILSIHDVTPVPHNGPRPKKYDEYRHMAFDTRAKRERALGERLNLKPQRSYSDKSEVAKRPYRPGPHGKSRRRVTEFGKQLAEKQKFRVTYGLREGQMRRYFKAASHSEQTTGEALISLLERRLDNVVFRLGFAPSRSVARQLVSHGHIAVNGRKSSTPSRLMKTGEVISVRKGSEGHPVLMQAKERLAKYDAPAWLKLDASKMEGSIASKAVKADVPFDISLVVDYYSKTVK